MMSSLSTFLEVMNIETRSTEAEGEARKPAAESAVGVDSFTSAVEESPLVGTDALGLLDSVESLLTDFVSLFHIDDSVSSWAAAGGEDGAATLLHFFTASVVIDHNDLLDVGKLG